MASSSGVVDRAEKLYDFKVFRRNCKNASGVIAAAIGYWQFKKKYRVIASLIGDFMVLILKKSNKFFNSLSS